MLIMELVNTLIIIRYNDYISLKKELYGMVELLIVCTQKLICDLTSKSSVILDQPYA